MTHAVHVIWSVYGLWLPRCPKGSWNEFATQWELALYGRTRSPQLGKRVESADFVASKRAAVSRWKAKFAPFDARQRAVINQAIAGFMRSHRSSVLACAILPEHVQVVYSQSPLERSDLGVGMRAEITRQLRSLEAREKTLAERRPDECLWSISRWRKELDSEAAVYMAIDYVQGLYGVQGVAPEPASYIQPWPPVLTCREAGSSYAFDSECLASEWRMAS